MGIFDFLKKDKWKYVPSGNLDKPIWSTQKDKQFITEGYNRIVWVYACVGAISSAVSSVPWLLYRKGRNGRLIEIHDHPILTLLNSKANPHMSSKDFLDYWATYLAIEGKFFAEYSNPQFPNAIYPLYPHYMNPIPHRTEFISGFEYRVDEPILYKSNEVLWSKFNDPLDVYQGQSPIRAMARTIDTENEAVDWNKSTLQNSGIPAGLISVQNPSPELSRRLEEEWKSRYGGSKNARKPIILNADKASYMSIGLSPIDMDFLEQRKVNRTEICAAFGVPSQIVGDPEGQTYSNYGEAQKAFWENTVISRYLDHILEKLQSDLLPRYADNLILKYDLSGVGALKENEDKKAARIDMLWKSGLIKRNEGRYALDFEDDIEKGNVYFNELMTQPTPPTSSAHPQQSVPTATEPEQMPMDDMEPEDDIEDIVEDQIEVELLSAKKKEPTNFPVAGEDKTITLANSQFELFPLDYAEDLRINYPSIWDEGGNVQGNDTYRVIRRIREESRSADELTTNDQEIVRMREAWSARHLEDHRLAGVIAQVKWHMVGSRGLDHMKSVIQEAKDKQEKALNLSPDEEKAYWKRIDDEREKIVEKTKREVNKAFDSDMEAILKSIENEAPAQATEAAFKAIDENIPAWRNMLGAMYIATVSKFGEQTYNELQKTKYRKKSFDPYTDELMYWITKQIAESIRFISDSTKREVKNAILIGIADGLPIGDSDTPDTISFLIAQAFDGFIKPTRSETIARTETMNAASKGSLDGAKQTGLNLMKKWVPTPDMDTRDSHRAMRGVMVGIDDLFDVGQSRGAYPADSMLSAKERINCRCAMSYKEIEE